MASKKQSKKPSVSIEEQTGEPQSTKQYDSGGKARADAWDIDEEEVIVIRGNQSEESREEIERSVEEVAEVPKEDDDSIPLPVMHKIIFIICLIGFIAAILYVLNYWGIIPLPW